MTYVFRYGQKQNGYNVLEGTEFRVRGLHLFNGRATVYEETVCVSGDTWGFGPDECFDERAGLKLADGHFED